MNKRNLNRRGLSRLLMAALLTIGVKARPADNPTLKDSYQQHFLIGTALNRNIATGNAGFRRTPEQVAKDIALVREQFNQVSPENDLKWQSIHPREGANGYELGAADAFVNFGVSNRM